ncbi:MAG: ATP synthase F1 subunit gamma [Candidatus Omnitrophica bacterium CG11_big_fil_rev_8_21_14_0_20_45_26]|uniref:ATP synthase gamma chain n=1 Tax=Candidatus Abzuiibacterium crystallinum TaxID=1974748 RepID=A0A2H0LPU0_9BACT|nr:MAG: ATP synthase F1 subunit gamma [Candidatus Omnitrophica bacterium CG11_big_fil_rev_8_21_14_0_20_45_26]PIW63695.1 MAG: ATP synthase F1 subunit gamma [Candidatus Omnitrophica bacterium CG12_big_fil_rev_8_21_14_0_65_45_16]
MIQSLRQIKRRIKSVENTRKITKAMEMVSAAKLRRYQALLGQARAYAVELERILKNLITSAPSFQHPLFEKREVKRVAGILISSDSGLCGSYNYNLFKVAAQFIQNHSETQSYFSLGRRGARFLKRSDVTVTDTEGIPKPQDMAPVMEKIINHAKQAFLGQTADEVYLIYTRFESMTSFAPVAEKLLPLEGIQIDPAIQNTADYILEPSPARILEEIIPHLLALKVEQAVKGALVSEQVSRMMAMRQATDNAKQMIDSLTLERNKARQATITKELIEIVSGFQAQQK